MIAIDVLERCVFRACAAGGFVRQYYGFSVLTSQTLWKY